jgi:hypothetical protein
MNSFKIFDARFKHPLTFLITGPSKSGKSSFTLNLIDYLDRLVDKDIDYIVWFYGEMNNTVQHLMSNKKVVLVKGLPNDLDMYIQPSKNGFMVFDDLQEDVVKSEQMSRLFCVDCHHKNLSACVILQSLFHGDRKERKAMLKNAHVLVLFNSPLDYSTARTVSQRLSPKYRQIFHEVYDIAVNKPHGYLLLDAQQDTVAEARFRSDIFGPVQKVYVPI